MALLKFKRSATPSKVPTTSDLSLGELAMNTYDGKLYMKKDDGTQAIVEIGAASGGGTWGSITGTLSNQTDLWNALSAKQDSATALTTTTSFGGDVSGTYNNIIVADDSHNHIIANVDGLQTALDGKLNLTGGTLTNKLTIQRAAFDVLQLNRTNSDNNVNIEFVGTSNTGYLGKVGTDLYWGVNADLNNLGYKIFHDNYHPNADKLTTARTISLTGDVSGSTSFDGSANVSISAVVADDSHNHIIANVDGLQTALDAKLNLSGGTLSGDLYTGDNDIFLNDGWLYFKDTGQDSIRLNGNGEQIDFYNQTDGKYANIRVGRATGDIDFRAPIFYDSANTAYYLDPASTGTSLTTAGSVGIGTTSPDSKVDIEAAHSQLRLTDSDDSKFVLFSYSGGKLITRNNSTTTSTEQFTLDESGRVGIGTISPSQKLQVQGASLILPAAGWSTGNTAYLYLGDTNNGLSSTFGNPTNVFGFHGVTFSAQGSQLGSFDTSGNGYATASFRAPIFYDSNNTAYYTNPASSTRLNGWLSFGIAGGGASTSGRWISIEGNADGSGEGSGRMFFSEHNGTTAAMDNYGMSLAYRGGSTSIVGASGNTWTGLTQIGNGEWGMFGHDNNAAGAVIMSGNRNATYVKVHGASGVWAHQIRRRNGTRAIDLDNSVYTQFLNPSGSIRLWLGNNNRNYYNNDNHIFRNSASTTSMTINSIGTVIATSDFRAPIFYDSNNTAFYVNPDGTSNCNDIKAENLPYAKAGSAYGTENTFTGDGGVGADNISRSMFYRDNAGQFGALGVNITHATSANYALQIACTSYSTNTGTFKFRLKNNGTWTGATTLIDDGTANQIKSGYLQSNSNLRAPIFYDSQNTGYYVDPTGLSVLFKFDNINQRVAYDRAWGNYPSITVYNTTDQGPQGDFRIHGIGGANGGDFSVRLLVDGTIESLSNVRAPIFYDSNNTGRYADLASTGDSIRASGDIVAYYSDDRLKDRGDNIANALDKVQSLNGFHYTANETAQKFGYKANPQVGVSAQEVEAILPEVVKDAAIGHGYKTVDYAKLVPLLIEAIKELKAEVETLKKG